MSEGPTRDEEFETLWQRHGLERVKDELAFGETVTASTFAGDGHGERDPELQLARLSFTTPQLPHISLGPASAGGGAEPDVARAEAGSRDLVVSQTLGEGGMGRVLLARQRSLSRDVAVKVLKGAADEENALALLREALVMGGLEHPNIIPVHALGRDDEGRPVLVMKRVEGTSWKTLLDDPDHPAWRPLLSLHGDRRDANLQVLLSVADAAHFAHSRGVVHRDIKPDNVMVGAFGEVYLVDWGIALRLGSARRSPSQPFSIRGTPAYMAPEMVDGDPARVDARTDVYLLGATLHEVLTRTARHSAPTLHGVLYAAYVSAPVAYSADISEELGQLCNSATHADPAARPQSAQDFRRRLADHLQHRASLMLSNAANERLEALTADRGKALTDADYLRIYNLATECRFGYAQALQVWDGNARAREGLQRVLRIMFEHELTRESLDAARAVADALHDDSPETRARLDALQETLRLRRERESVALREAHESDLTRGARARGPLFGLVTALSVIFTAVTLYTQAHDPRGVDLRTLLIFNVTICVFVGIGIFIARRQLLVNRISRQLTAFLFMCVIGTLLHRVVAYLHPTPPPLALVILDDQFMLVMLFSMGAITLRRWLAWMAAWALAGCVFTLLMPSRAPESFTVTGNGLMLLAMYFGWVRALRTS